MIARREQASSPTLVRRNKQKKPAEIGGQYRHILHGGGTKVKWHGTQSFSKIRAGFFTWEMLLPAFHEGKVVVYCHQAMNLEEHEYA